MTMHFWFTTHQFAAAIWLTLAADNSGWVCCALPIALVVIGGIIKAIAYAGEGALGAAEGMSLRLMSEEHRIAGAVVVRFFLRGKMTLPASGVLVRSVLTVVDITESTTAPQRVLGIDSGHSGPDGVLVEVKQTLVESSRTDWQVFNVGFVAEPLVVCARSGRRKLRATVALHSRFGPLGQWYHDFTLDETSMGYLEAAKRKTESKLGVARFVLAIAACDGTIDQREGETIQRLFADRFNLENDSDSKTEFKNAFRDARQSLAVRTTTPVNMMDQAAQVIKNDDGLRELAFEFAVQVAAADGTIATAEQTMLDRGAEKLGLPDADKRRIIERFVRVDMYASESRGSGAGGEQTSEAELRRALQVPAGLQGPALSAWLTAEYGKWNGLSSLAYEA
jgi:tellurite resistance protein